MVSAADTVLFTVVRVAGGGGGVVLVIQMVDVMFFSQPHHQ